MGGVEHQQLDKKYANFLTTSGLFFEENVSVEGSKVQHECLVMCVIHVNKTAQPAETYA